MTNSDVPVIKAKIWDVVDGPFPADIPIAPEVHYNLCKIEVDGKIEHTEFFFNTFDDAYEMVKHFHKSIEPIEVDYD